MTQMSPFANHKVGIVALNKDCHQALRFAKRSQVVN